MKMWLLLVTTIVSAVLTDAGYLYNAPNGAYNPLRMLPANMQSLPYNEPHDFKITQQHKDDRTITYSITYKDYIYVKGDDVGANNALQQNSNYNNLRVNGYNTAGNLASQSLPNVDTQLNYKYPGYVQSVKTASNFNHQYAQPAAQAPVNNVGSNIGYSHTTSRQNKQNTVYDQTNRLPSTASYSNNYAQTSPAAINTGYTHTVSAQDNSNYNSGYSQASSHFAPTSNVVNSVDQGFVPIRGNNLHNGYSYTASTTDSSKSGPPQALVEVKAPSFHERSPPAQSTSLDNGYSQSSQSSAPLSSVNNHGGYARENLNNGYSQVAQTAAVLDNGYSQAESTSVSFNSGYSQAAPTQNTLTSGYTQTAPVATSSNNGHTYSVSATSLNSGYNQPAQAATSLNSGYSQPEPTTTSLNSGYSQTVPGATSSNSGYTHSISATSLNSGYNQPASAVTSLNSRYSHPEPTATALNSGYTQSAPVAIPLNSGYSQSASAATSLNSGYTQSGAAATPLSGEYNQIVASSTSYNANAGYAQNFVQPSNIGNGYAETASPTASANLNTGSLASSGSAFTGNANFNGGYDYTPSAPGVNVNDFVPSGISTACSSVNTDYSQSSTGPTHIDLNSVIQSTAVAVPGLENGFTQTLTSSSEGLSSDLTQSNLNSVVNPSSAGAPVSQPVTPVIHKHIYFHVPPPEVEEPPKALPPPPPPQKNYKILFIKMPSQESKSQVARLQQQIAQMQNAAVEDKTLIYVLVKKPEDPQPIELTTPKPKPSEHQVFFVKYNGSPFDIASQVSNEFDKTGGVKSIVPLEPGLINGQHK